MFQNETYYPFRTNPVFPKHSPYFICLILVVFWSSLLLVWLELRCACSGFTLALVAELTGVHVQNLLLAWE